jgi:release factor glutamine methyltransferase
MLPTPSTNHVSFDRIYEPAEDSYLLLDTLSSKGEKEFLGRRFLSLLPSQKLLNGQQTKSYSPAPLVVEVGTGSGVVLAFLTANCQPILGRSDVQALGIDINRHACLATRETVHAAQDPARQNGIFLDAINGDLATALRPNEVDVLIFNPPYVPTEEVPRIFEEGQTGRSAFEEDSQLLALSYAGGQDGMEVTTRLLDQLPTILNGSRGVAYILLCAQNKPGLVKARIRSWGPEWSAELVGSSGKQAGWEKLQVLRISRIPNTYQTYAFYEPQSPRDHPLRLLDLAATKDNFCPPVKNVTTLATVVILPAIPSQSTERIRTPVLDPYLDLVLADHLCLDHHEPLLLDQRLLFGPCSLALARRRSTACPVVTNLGEYSSVLSSLEC